ncbi:MAG TPA: hypothetical protein VGI19_07070 [Candidatus Cybelea sp.]|jgi:hypothetical protein
MNRSRSVIGIAIVLFALLAVPARNVTAQGMGTPSATGDWHVEVTGDVFLSGTAHMTQQAARVVGTVPAKAGGTIQFNGTLTNDKLSGEWRSPKNETGWMTLFFTQSGNGFSGEWGYHGRSPNGSVVGTRVK